MLSPRPIRVIACAVFQEALRQRLSAGQRAEVQFLDSGLHLVPANLKVTLQETLDSLPEPSRVILGYGLCGGGLNGIEAGPHQLIVPRADDCITLFFGSYDQRQKDFDKHPGSYYITPGWLEAGTHPLGEYERLQKKYDEETSMWIMDQQYQHYERLVLLADSKAALDEHRDKAKAVAAFCARWDMKYEEKVGRRDYLDTLAAIITGDARANDDFITIAPGERLTMNDFNHQE